MKYSKIFQYAYLVFAVLFIYDGITKWNNGANSAYISLGLAALLFLCISLEENLVKKYENKDNSK